MKRFIKKSASYLIIFTMVSVMLAGFFLLSSPALPARAETAATISTDKTDYEPGQTVNFTGTGFEPGESVHISAKGTTHGTTLATDAVADVNGAFTATLNLPIRYEETYSLVATGASSGRVAQTSFGDPISRWDFVNPINNPILHPGDTLVAVAQAMSGSTPTPGVTPIAWSTTGGTVSPVAGDPSTTGADGRTSTTLTAGTATGTFTVIVSGGGRSNNENYRVRLATTLAVAPASGNVGGTTTLSATLTSGGTGVNGKTINFTLNGSSAGSAATNSSGVATLSGASLAGIAAGIYPTGVGATFTLDGTYDGSSGSNTLTVSSPATTTTVASSANPSTYGDSVTFTATVTGSVVTEGTVTFKEGATVLSGPTVLNGSGQASFLTSGLTAGSHTITAEYSGSTNYNPSSGSVEQTVTLKDASVTPAANSKVYGAADPALTGALSGFLVGDGVSAVYSRTAGETVAGSPYTISAVLSPAGVLGNYNITYNTASFTITPKPVTVTADAKSKVFGDPDPALTYTSSDPSATFSGALTRAAGETVAGSPYAITQGTLAGTGNYAIGSFVGANFTITARPIAVTADAKSKVYGNPDPALTFTVGGSGLASGDTIASVFTGALIRAAGETVAGSPYAITQGTLGANTNYNITGFIPSALTITAATTVTTASVSAAKVHYKDLVTLSAKVVPLNTASALTGSVAFKIGSNGYGSANVVPIPGAIDGSVQATVIVQENELPGDYTVTATFTSTNGNYSGSVGTTPLHVDPRNVSPYGDLTGLYTGDGWAWTTGPNTNTATVTLSATLKDNGDPAGDLRAAKVTFYYVIDGKRSAISSAQNVPVGLVNITDGTVGTASAIVQMNIGNSYAESFQIAVGVTGGYTNNPGDLTSQGIFTVSKPVANGQMVGSGILLNRASSGLVKAPDTSRTLWDFSITYTKSGTNPKGKVEFTFTSFNKPDGTLDSTLHTYRATSNAIASLAVSPPNNGLGGTASFSSKANVTDITNPSAPVGIDSGTVLQITVTDTGNADTLGITLQRKAGGIWYSSSWSINKTVEILAGGTINIGF